MPGSINSHLVREDDGAWVATWAPFALKSAFQPIFRFEDGKLPMVAFESLLRPFRDRQAQSPASFLASMPAHERMQADALARSLHLCNAADCLPPDASIFVNFDPSVFADQSIVDMIARDMRRVAGIKQIEPHRIVCEVTEKETQSEEVLFNVVGALRRSGFRIAVDDYGVEASDISRIHELRPDIVKFDADWIKRLMESSAGFALLTTMVSTFREHGIDTVFEGIEDGEQLELAERSGVTMVQGFGLAQPELAPTNFAIFAPPAQPAVQHHDAPMFGSVAQPRAGGDLRHARAFGRRAQPE